MKIFMKIVNFILNDENIEIFPLWVRKTWKLIFIEIIHLGEFVLKVFRNRHFFAMASNVLFLWKKFSINFFFEMEENEMRIY